MFWGGCRHFDLPSGPQRFAGRDFGTSGVDGSDCMLRVRVGWGVDDRFASRVQAHSAAHQVDCAPAAACVCAATFREVGFCWCLALCSRHCGTADIAGCSGRQLSGALLLMHCRQCSGCLLLWGRTVVCCVVCACGLFHVCCCCFAMRVL